MLNVKTTDELTTKELITIFKARVAVFVVEQDCPYQEVDEQDYDITNVFLTSDDGQLQAYIRIIQFDDHVSFGRVLVAKPFRGQGLGHQIVAETLKVINEKFQNQPIQIQAQAYLEKFYGGFGFKSVSKTYLEDGIPHIDMEMGATH
ncbi:GNAT family N-acetyltransferase [Lactobacillaceae bacterium Melli_B3]